MMADPHQRESEGTHGCPFKRGVRECGGRFATSDELDEHYRVNHMLPSPRDQYALPDGRVGDLGLCRSCGAEVVWIGLPSGKRPPFNKDGASHFATCASAYLWKGKAER